MKKLALAVAVITLTAVCLASEAEAQAADPTKEQCVAANEETDALRKKDQLRAARDHLLICVSKSCPKIIRDDCTEQLANVEKAIPTITFSARTPKGDVAAVKVTIDGAPLTDRVDGTQIPVDPGEHTFEFTTEGYPPVTKKLVVREGIKGRPEFIMFEAPMQRQVGHLVVKVENAAVVTIDRNPPAPNGFEGFLDPGAHHVLVTKPGKVRFETDVDVKVGEAHTLAVAGLQNEKVDLLPWVIGGAIVVAAGIVVGGIAIFSGGDK